jgi:polyhydroxybutyrate depolymerase
MRVPSLLLTSLLATDPLAPGDHVRKLKVDKRTRSYLVHVPPDYDPEKPTPVVLIFHGAGTNGRLMVRFCGMNKKADEAGFIAVYPNGTGLANLLLIWNSGHFARQKKDPDDVRFVERLLDDLATVVHVDPMRVYATGHSNGAMMCYRLATELSNRIAAIAPVSGTIATDEVKLKRPVPLIHFHGTADKILPHDGPTKRTPSFVTFKSVQDTIRIWARANGCRPEASLTDIEDKVDDGTTVQRKSYASGTDNAEIIVYIIHGGGHTWPGLDPPLFFLGRSTKNISANDLIWDFFQRHPMR